MSKKRALGNQQNQDLKTIGRCTECTVNDTARVWKYWRPEASIRIREPEHQSIFLLLLLQQQKIQFFTRTVVGVGVSDCSCIITEPSQWGNRASISAHGFKNEKKYWQGGFQEQNVWKERFIHSTSYAHVTGAAFFTHLFWREGGVFIDVGRLGRLQVRNCTTSTDHSTRTAQRQLTLTLR